MYISIYQIYHVLFADSIFLAAWFVIATLSCVFQYRVTSKDATQGGKICPVSATTICKCLLPCCFDCTSKDKNCKNTGEKSTP